MTYNECYYYDSNCTIDQIKNLEQDYVRSYGRIVDFGGVIFCDVRNVYDQIQLVICKDNIDLDDRVLAFGNIIGFAGYKFIDNNKLSLKISEVC